VPLVMRYDRMFPKNETRSNHFVGLNDLYATVAEIVGVKIPRRSAQDSISFASYIQSEKNVQGLRQHLGTWAYKKDGIKGEAIRHGHLKLVRNFRKGQDELYDLSKDKGETNNILDEFKNRTTNLQYAGAMVLEEMYQVLKSIGPCPDEAGGDVVLTIGRNTGRVVTCDWFKKKPRRCIMQPVAATMCNSVCGLHENLCSKYPNDSM
jgi:Arylsulfatase A and related enzymes